MTVLRDQALRDGRITRPPADADNDPLDKVIAILRDLKRQRFFGELEIKFENGTVVQLWKSESIKPNTYRTEARGNHEPQPR